MILFVDQDNNLLHEIPLQLIAKGRFQFEFDQKLCEFRTAMVKAYSEDQKKRITSMKDSWYNMCVFVPTFKSKMRGEGSKHRKACITTGYENPTKENWLSFCVGRCNDLAPSEPMTYMQHIYKLYCETKKSCEAKGWWKRENELL